MTSMTQLNILPQSKIAYNFFFTYAQNLDITISVAVPALKISSYIASEV